MSEMSNALQRNASMARRQLNDNEVKTLLERHSQANQPVKVHVNTKKLRNDIWSDDEMAELHNMLEM